MSDFRCPLSDQTFSSFEEVARHCSECYSTPSWRRGGGQGKGEKKVHKTEKQEQVVKKQGIKKREPSEFKGEKPGVATSESRGQQQVNLKDDEDSKKEAVKMDKTKNVKKVVKREDDAKKELKKSSLTDGSLPEQERGLTTPLASRPGVGVSRVGQGRGGKPSKMKRLLNFQSGLCDTCGLPPSRLMREAAVGIGQTVKRLETGMVRRRRRLEVKTTRRGRRTRGGEEVLTIPTFHPQALTSREYNSSMLWCSGEEGLELG